jgi:hyperosmotically inducible protein
VIRDQISGAGAQRFNASQRNFMMIHANLRKGLFAVAIVAGLGTVPFAQATTDDVAVMPHSNDQAVVGKIDDAMITTKIRSTFAANKAVKGGDISVGTMDGIVTLRGTVTTAREKSRVETLAMKVKGVKSVDGSALVVSPDKKSAAVQ